MIFVAQIKAAVAQEYGLELDAMSEPDGVGAREWKHCHPRQLAICLSARLTEQSLSNIGRLFGGRNHSTVISACKAVERRRVADPKLHNAMRRITLQLVRR